MEHPLNGLRGIMMVQINNNIKMSFEKGILIDNFFFIHDTLQ